MELNGMSYTTTPQQKPIGSTSKIHKKVVNGVVNDSNPNDVYTPRKLLHR